MTTFVIQTYDTYNKYLEYIIKSTSSFRIISKISSNVIIDVRLFY